MRISKKSIAPAALLAAGANAQTTLSVISGPGDGTTTEYYTYCSTTPTGIITLTGTVTETYCPGPSCTGHTSVPTVAPDQRYTTVYTTVYPEFCSTGYQPKTYTITETDCPCRGIGRSGYYPPGFTTTVTSCNTCGPKTLTATLTIPIPGHTGGAPRQGPTPPGPDNGSYQPPPAQSMAGSLPGSPSGGSPDAGGSDSGNSDSGSSGAGSGSSSDSSSDSSPDSDSWPSPSGSVSGSGGDSGSGSGSSPAAPASRVDGASGPAPTSGADNTGSMPPGETPSGPAEFQGTAGAVSVQGFLLTSLAVLAGAVTWIL